MQKIEQSWRNNSTIGYVGTQNNTVCGLSKLAKLVYLQFCFRPRPHFCCVFAYRPHLNDRKRWWKRKLSKTASKVERFQWKRSVFSVDGWKRRLLKTVPRNASYVVVSIIVFGRFSVDVRRRRTKKYAFSNENELVWTGENKTKTRAGENILLCFRRDENGYF